jgi:hypothetical protein
MTWTLTRILLAAALAAVTAFGVLAAAGPHAAERIETGQDAAGDRAAVELLARTWSTRMNRIARDASARKWARSATLRRTGTTNGHLHGHGGRRRL